MQSYLKSIEMKPHDAKLIVSYSVRIAFLSENVWGVARPNMWQLCSTHLDKQKIAFRCPERGGDKKIYFKWNIEEEKIRGEKKLEKFGFYYKSLSLNIERWVELFGATSGSI